MKTQKERMNRSYWEKQDRICHKTGLPMNLEALMQKQADCEHPLALGTKFVEVSPNYWLREVYCPDCGRLLEIQFRKTLPTVSFFSLAEIEAENKKGDDLDE